MNTFFLFSGIVVLFICISLLIKVGLVILHSKFDPNHNFVVVVAKDNKIRQVIGFGSSSQSLSILKTTGKKIALSDGAKTLGVPVEGKINADPKNFKDEKISNLFSRFLFNYQNIETNLTLFDMARLYFQSQHVSANNISSKELELPVVESRIDKVVSGLFMDDSLLTEKVSIQIINASDIPGMGKRLERILVNIGGSVVSVTTSRKSEKSSSIEYSGEKTYTLEKIGRLLQMPVVKSEKQSIANIVITIGMDSKKTQVF